MKCVCVYAYVCLSSHQNGPVYNSMLYLVVDKCSRTTRFATETSALLFHPLCVRAGVCVYGEGWVILVSFNLLCDSYIEIVP